MNTMMYKGYVGKIEYDDELHVFTGTVANTKAVITFQGMSVEELTREFQISVDDYLEWCRKDGVEPERPYSGRFNVRLDPDTHRRASIKAKNMGISLNRFVEKALVDELNILEG